MQEFITTSAAVFVCTLIQCLVMIHCIDRLATNVLPFSKRKRYTVKMRKPQATGEWLWCPYDSWEEKFVRNPSTNGIPQWSTESECQSFCDTLERTGGLE